VGIPAKSLEAAPIWFAGRHRPARSHPLAASSAFNRSERLSPPLPASYRAAGSDHG